MAAAVAPDFDAPMCGLKGAPTWKTVRRLPQMALRVTRSQARKRPTLKLRPGAKADQSQLLVVLVAVVVIGLVAVGHAASVVLAAVVVVVAQQSMDGYCVDCSLIVHFGV